MSRSWTHDRYRAALQAIADGNRSKSKVSDYRIPDGLTLEEFESLVGGIHARLSGALKVGEPPIAIASAAFCIIRDAWLATPHDPEAAAASMEQCVAAIILELQARCEQGARRH
jgi:hypothetical protein